MRDAELDAEDSRSEVYVRGGNKANAIRTRGLQGRSEYVNSTWKMRKESEKSLEEMMPKEVFQHIW